MERPRFFSRQQKIEHQEVVGEGCEVYVLKGERCQRTRVEADHVQPFSKGGETEGDNLSILCIIHHAWKHWLDGEWYSAKLIKNRMTQEEQEELKRMGIDL